MLFQVVGPTAFLPRAEYHNSSTTPQNGDGDIGRTTLPPPHVGVTKQSPLTPTSAALRLLNTLKPMIPQSPIDLIRVHFNRVRNSKR